MMLGDWCFFAGWFAFWNCARGRKLFGMTDSTTVGRLVATWCMAMACCALLVPDTTQMTIVFAWVWATLMLWCTPAWDNYWSVTIGDQSPPVKCFAPVDFIMGLPPFKWLRGRIWGVVALTLRMQLVLPCYLGAMWYLGNWDRLEWLFGTLLLGLPYYISGYISPRKYVISAAEVATGAIMGVIAFAIMN